MHPPPADGSPLGLNQHLNLLQSAVRLPLQDQHVIRLKPFSLFEGIQMEHPLISNENHLLVDLPKPVDVCIKVCDKGLFLRCAVIVRIGKPILTSQIQPITLIHGNVALRHAHPAVMRPGIVGPPYPRTHPGACMGERPASPDRSPQSRKRSRQSAPGPKTPPDTASSWTAALPGSQSPGGSRPDTPRW